MDFVEDDDDIAVDFTSVTADDLAAYPKRS